MKKFLGILLLAHLSALAMTGCDEGGTSAGQIVRVCYIPFSASTYAAIHRASFDKQCTDLGDMELEHEPMRGLFESVQRGKPVNSFDDNAVRLSMRMSDGSLSYINQDGEVVRGARVVKISSEAIAQLDRELYKLQQRLFERR